MNYIYALCYPDKTPFYIGVTMDIITRFKSHIAETRNGVVSLKNEVIAKILKNGQEPFLIQLEHTDNRDEALRIEAKYIKSFPNLTNVHCPHLIMPRRKKERIYLLSCKECGREWESSRLIVQRWSRCYHHRDFVWLRAKWLYDPLMKQTVNYEDLERDRKALGLVF